MTGIMGRTDQVVVVLGFVVLVIVVYLAESTPAEAEAGTVKGGG